MKKFIKDQDWVALFLSLVYAILFVICIFGSFVEAHADELQGKCIVVSSEKVDKKPVDTGYTIKIDGKIYKIYRGPRGGLFYVIDGKPKYLTKKQKELIK